MRVGILSLPHLLFAWNCLSLPIFPAVIHGRWLRVRYARVHQEAVTKCARGCRPRANPAMMETAIYSCTPKATAVAPIETRERSLSQHRRNVARTGERCRGRKARSPDNVYRIQRMHVWNFINMGSCQSRTKNCRCPRFAGFFRRGSACRPFGEAAFGFSLDLPGMTSRSASAFHIRDIRMISPFPRRTGYRDPPPPGRSQGKRHRRKKKHCQGIFFPVKTGLSDLHRSPGSDGRLPLSLPASLRMPKCAGWPIPGGMGPAVDAASMHDPSGKSRRHRWRG